MPSNSIRRRLQRREKPRKKILHLMAKKNQTQIVSLTITIKSLEIIIITTITVIAITAIIIIITIITITIITIVREIIRTILRRREAIRINPKIKRIIKKTRKDRNLRAFASIMILMTHLNANMETIARRSTWRIRHCLPSSRNSTMREISFSRSFDKKASARWRKYIYRDLKE
jgi:hypothetical protein